MKQRIIGVLFVLMVLWSECLVATAATMEGAKITMSPDGEAFTTNAKDTNVQWYEKGYETDTGVRTSLKAPKKGEHEYIRIRTDIVPIEKWVVHWSQSKCVHCTTPAGNQYHGIHFGTESCGRPYFSGWFPYCADCGKVAEECLFYMSEDVAKSIKALDIAQTYYYTCPYCDSLEQGKKLTGHACRGISPNRYFVRYHANFGKGSMKSSNHMVNNATEYEGREVTPQTTLNINTFIRDGYEFTGWNTQKDGKGQSFEDGATIYNLCMEDNESIILYAQWRRRTSTLEIDPNGGAYGGKTGIEKVKGDYRTEYRIETSLLSAPGGQVVHFNTMGGAPVSDIRTENIFKEWSYSDNFSGRINGNVYQFLGENGTTDRIVAQYEQKAIVLPMAKREGYSFGGWYMDAQGTIPIGQAGDSFQPTKETTLYAYWVDLQLVSTDNYLSNQGKGAVNLSWTQKDNKDKVYEIYQKKEAGTWNKINTVDEDNTYFDIGKSILYSGNKGTYTIPYSGFYTLRLTGAQGGNYGSHTGGKGGCTEATIYFNKGEKLEYIIGGQNGYNGGGKGLKYGNGGGYSVLSSSRHGIIMVAGGGGGASKSENGGVGGSTRQIIAGSNGANEEAGGGGGNCGGCGGLIEQHTHTNACRHIHIGTPGIFGGCYTVKIPCGSKDIEFRETHTVFYYGNLTEKGELIYCVRCASYECPGHLDRYGAYFCKKCGYNQTQRYTQCNAMTGYGLGCEMDEKMTCGYTDGQIIRSVVAGGGSNFIQKQICVNYKDQSGIQQGNGMLLIQSKQIGVQEERQCNGVPATDLAGPEAIDKSGVVITVINDKEVRVGFRKPKDNGTTYYHQIKSYNKNTMEYLCESNITKNTLTSKVAGYRYTVDTMSTTEVSNKDTMLREKGESPFLVIPAEERIKYLHIAAEDTAGNIGPTIHIRISNQEIVYWPLLIEKLIIQEGANVAVTEEERTYFVKADHNTPIELTLEGLLCGTARKEYQIDEADFVVENVFNNMDNGMFSVLVPKREKINEGTYTYPTEKIGKQQTGSLGMEDALFTTAQRYNSCKSLLVKQKFVISGSMDGQKLRIMPRVAAKGEKETVFSKEEEDLKNSIYLIPDAIGPSIKGAEGIESLMNSGESLKEKYEIVLEAYDSGSGLAQFYLEIQNWDNGLVANFEDAELSGKIELVIEPDNPLFYGDFSVHIYAKDRVANETSIHSGIINAGLNASVSRILEPHTPIFKRGESGVLRIKTWGYMNRLEIRFPEYFTAQDPSLNRTIIYENPGYMKEEEITFMVPFSVPDGQVVIEVKGYKEGVEYNADPKLLTIKIEGDIRDELRTRLR
ncbi:MAG: InlB B-repeat-containing protein [Lachnospiraceae bacterium]|nr:InlB B-repeat-containing protein [Lachnospiraceae bacterium]